MTHGRQDERSELERRVRQHLRDGDSNSGATAVIEALGPGVLRFLTGMLPADDAKDAFSDFQQAVWRGLPAFRWECSLRAWSYLVARNAALRITRDGYRRRRTPLSPDLAWVPEEPDTADRSDEFVRIQRALEPGEQALLALRVGRSLKWNEVAAVLAAAGDEISSAAIRKRFERLKLKLAGMVALPSPSHFNAQRLFSRLEET
jgi:RNA polymerase sigma-70 factor (ECF subfamily)